MLASWLKSGNLLEPGVKVTAFKENQYKKSDWPFRIQHIIGQKNVENKELVSKDRIFMPPLHVKLGVVQSFEKTVKNEMQLRMS